MQKIIKRLKDLKENTQNSPAFVKIKHLFDDGHISFEYFITNVAFEFYNSKEYYKLVKIKRENIFGPRLSEITDKIQE